MDDFALPNEYSLEQCPPCHSMISTGNLTTCVPATNYQYCMDEQQYYEDLAAQEADNLACDQTDCWWEDDEGNQNYCLHPETGQMIAGSYCDGTQTIGEPDPTNWEEEFGHQFESPLMMENQEDIANQNTRMRHGGVGDVNFRPFQDTSQDISKIFTGSMGGWSKPQQNNQNSPINTLHNEIKYKTDREIKEMSQNPVVKSLLELISGR